MFEAFDPYEKWLGISKGEQPANYYRLLGVTAFEATSEEIERNWEERMVLVKRRSTGKRATLSQQILNELTTAKLTLLDHAKRVEYDDQLMKELARAKLQRETQRADRKKKSRFKGGEAFAEEPPNAARAGQITSHDLEGQDDDGRIHIKQRNPVDAEMDMTPMVDCTFLLLIFFMVSASFGMQKAEQVAPPKETDPSTVVVEQEVENENEFVVIRIDSNNYYHILIGNEPREEPSKQGMIEALTEAREKGIDGVIPTRLRIIAHGDSSHERFVAAIDAGIAVGMEEIKSEITESDEAP
jgi:biopolymer transport protein ExbD